MMLVPFCSEYSEYLTEFNDTTFKVTQCNLHTSAKWPIHVFLGAILAAHCITHQNGRDAPPPPPPPPPPWLQQNEIYQKQVVFRSTSSFAPKWSNFFTCFGELMLCFKDFLFCYVRYYLSLVTRKPVFGVLGQLKFNLVCSATDVS